jgi:hypothetical protein
MRALINGVEGGTLNLTRGQDATWYLDILTDLGDLVVLTGETVTLEFYNAANRANAATLSQAVVLTTPTLGFATVTITDANSALLAYGTNYWVFVKRVDAGALISYAPIPTLVKAI